MWPVGTTMEFSQFPICTHEGGETGRLRPRPFAALLPTQQKHGHAGEKSDQHPNNDFHRETFREITGSEWRLPMKWPNRSPSQNQPTLYARHGLPCQ